MSNLQNYVLIGAANSGKSTLFNKLTGGKAITGNWTGVTVSAKQTVLNIAHKSINLIDLPGISSLTQRAHQSKDISITQDFIKKNKVDCLINVVDATQLNRQLLLTTQLLELGLPMIVVLNKSDRKEAIKIDTKLLSTQLGCLVIELNSLEKGAKSTLSQHLVTLPRQTCRPEGLHVPDVILPKLESQSLLNYEQGLYEEDCVCTSSNDEVLAIMQSRHLFVRDTLEKVSLASSANSTLSDRLDHLILHPILGIPFFLGMMYLLFMFAINVGGAFIDFFDIVAGTLFVDYPNYWMASLGIPQWVNTIIEGIGIGIQTVATFIPIIAALFIGLSLLESSGYLARAAFVVDSLMHKLGLPGKAFVPLIVGFGCTVPAVMSARILDSERERISTIMMSPFMSCGARLPVYALFAAAFFPESGQNLVFLLYLIGIFAAVFTGLLLKATVLQGTSSINIMELPLYELPKISYLVERVYQRTKSFVLGAGKTIVIVVCVLNFFNSLGVDGEFGHQDTDTSVLSQGAQWVTPLLKPIGVKEENWQASVGLITGIFAKEALVATFNSLYSANEDTDKASEPDFSSAWSEAVGSISPNLSSIAPEDPLGTDIGDVSDIAKAAQEQEVNQQTFESMQLAFAGKIGAFSYLLFILLYTPCAAAMGAIKSEVGSNWAAFAALWSFSLAYFTSTLVYQIATVTATPVFSIVCLGAVFLSFCCIYFWLKYQGSKILTIPTKVSYV